MKFIVTSSGSSPHHAFETATMKAKLKYGNGGFSGTIAEKGSFLVIKVPKGWDPFEYADRLVREEDPRIADVWNPAGCIELGNNEYLFFGKAIC